MTERKEPEYSSTPRARRGNRRATGGSAVGGSEPRLAGLTPSATPVEQSQDAQRDEWMKAQKPPHYGL
ncbi:MULTISPECIES: hypothetical protein [unclassified Rothia (in: high G+C Gram-positive bacteria)]|uniref:hypothetical protein n=1 Tax=unclassified Rothia (in: high G+C Gram-positive bacteria) TaxID=2689056 RepID=UPI00195A2DAE|nr:MULTISPECIES: hypothetical protein [unclassified Rothia (in: high G+C Gram-positive bacteria)]MBM7051162.1 hypothetical protein [Rothia sp. ZJ1223]QRZ62141.1 hypothetical protein JR346_03220 [Rothia sp. ZJ932]